METAIYDGITSVTFYDGIPPANCYKFKSQDTDTEYFFKVRSLEELDPNLLVHRRFLSNGLCEITGVIKEDGNFILSYVRPPDTTDSHSIRLSISANEVQLQAYFNTFDIHFNRLTQLNIRDEPLAPIIRF